MSIIRQDEKIRTALRDWECEECGMPIKEGNQYLDASFAYKTEDDFGSGHFRICLTCHEYLTIQDPISWCQKHGADVKYQDYSYHVGYWYVPETVVSVETENHYTEVSWSAGLEPEFNEFIQWISDNPDLPDPPGEWFNV